MPDNFHQATRVSKKPGLAEIGWTKRNEYPSVPFPKQLRFDRPIYLVDGEKRRKGESRLIADNKLDFCF